MSENKEANGFYESTKKWQKDMDKKAETMNINIRRVNEKVDDLYKVMDVKIKQKIKRIALKYLDVKWQAFGVMIAIMAVHAGIIFLITGR